MDQKSSQVKPIVGTIFAQRLDKLVHGYYGVKRIPIDILNLIVLLLNISNKIIFDMCCSTSTMRRFEIYCNEFVSRIVPKILINKYLLTTDSLAEEFQYENSTNKLYDKTQNLGFIDVDFIQKADDWYNISGLLHAIKVTAVDINGNIICSSEPKAIYSRGGGVIFDGYTRRYNFDKFFAENLQRTHQNINSPKHITLEQWIEQIGDVDLEIFEMKRIFCHILHHNNCRVDVIDQYGFVKFMDECKRTGMYIDKNSSHAKYIEIVKNKSLAKSDIVQLSLFG